MNKIAINIAESILTVGCTYNPPKGGIAQVMYNYQQYVFPVFKCVVNSKKTNFLYKVIFALFAIIKTCFILITDREIKIVHIHTASYNSFRRSALYVGLAKVFHKKVILHIHGGGFKDFYKNEPQSVKKILDKCDSIIALTKNWQKFFQQISECQHIYVVNNIVTPPRFIKQSDDNIFHLLYLGKISQQKGIFDLLDLVEKNINFFRNRLILHIAGNGDTERLKTLILTKGIADIVTFEGWADNNKKIELLNRADALILPSYTEGLPVAILEAMTYVLPVVATTVGGIPEIVSPETGLLFHPGNKIEMFKCLRMLVNNEYHFNPQRIAEIAQQFLPSNIVKQLTEIYNSLLYEEINS